MLSGGETPTRDIDWQFRIVMDFASMNSSPNFEIAPKRHL